MFQEFKTWLQQIEHTGERLKKEREERQEEKKCS